MKILIDADGCPVVDCTLACARQRGIEVLLICDTAHFFEREGATTVTVSKGADLVVTQDYGLAAMALAKQALVLSQNGMQYTADNIDALLLARHTARKIRMGGGRLKGPAKRTREQDEDFRRALCALLEGNR